MPIYGSVEQFPIALDEMERAIRLACGQQTSPTSHALTPPLETSPTSLTSPSPGEISLVEEGWTDSLQIEGLTLLPGYYYRIYENTRYPCGAQGYHQFMVLDNGTDTSTQKHLFAKFLGGAVGFWYYDSDDVRVYYPHERAVGVLTESWNRNMMSRTTVSQGYANGVTKRFRDNGDFRILVPSYCSHDLHHGRGEYSDVDGFYRYGYLAAMEAVDYVQEHFNINSIITYGGSSGADNFYIGKDQDNVAGIIMDSQAIDLGAISDACHDGYNVFGASYPCFCPEGSPTTCMEILAPRIGFTLGQDEPYHYVERGEVSRPIYLVWNERDASIYAHLQYDNLHNAILQYNPGGNSVANKVCITNPESPPGPICNLHVPSAYDYPETIPLVEEIYFWALSLIGYSMEPRAYVPLLLKP
jgi:hypothetical protein